MTLAAPILAHTAGGPADWALPVALVTVPATVYLGAARRLREGGRHWNPWRTAAFLGGLALVALATSPGPGMLTAGEARPHMVEHLLLGMYAPIGLVLGAPLTLLMASLPTGGRRRVRRVLDNTAARVLAHPATAALLDVGGLFVLSLTGLTALTLTNEFAHHLVHVHFLLAGSLFTWAIAGPDPAPRRPSVMVRTGVLVVAMAAHAFLAKLLFARAPALPPGTAYARSDVEAAAQWMYYGGDGSEIALAAMLFAAWYRRGRRIRLRPGVDAATATPAAASG